MSERGNYKANFSPTVNCLRVIEKLNRNIQIYTRCQNWRICIGVQTLNKDLKTNFNKDTLIKEIKEKAK